MSEHSSRHEVRAVVGAELTPDATRLVLWAAGGRLMADDAITGASRQLAVEYLERVLDGVDRQEEYARKNGGVEPDVQLPVFGIMKVSEKDMRIEYGDPDFREVGSPLNPLFPELANAAKEGMETVVNHVEGAYRHYQFYVAAQQLDPTQTDVNWR